MGMSSTGNGHTTSSPRRASSTSSSNSASPRMLFPQLTRRNVPKQLPRWSTKTKRQLQEKAWAEARDEWAHDGQKIKQAKICEISVEKSRCEATQLSGSRQRVETTTITD